MTALMPAPTVSTPPPVVFFDGECAFCDRWINRVRDADVARRLRFGTKQGATFQQLAREHPGIANVESIVVLKRRADGEIEFLVRSAAIREALAGLEPFRAFNFFLRIVPAPLTDIGYRIFSKIRKPLFGKLARCRVPTEQERALFVD